MLLTDFFYQYKTNKTGVEGFFDQLRLNTKLKNDLENLKDQVPGIYVMLYCLDKRYTPLTYQSCIDFCNQLGLETTDDFLSWSNSLSDCKLKEVILYLDPPQPQLNVSSWEKISFVQLKQKILDLVDTKYIEEHLSWNWQDSEYQIPLEEDVKKIIEFDVTNKMPYISEERDCDDFARLFKCFWEHRGLGNVTISYCEINIYSKNYERIIGAHAINCILWKNGNDYEVKLYEPQTDQFYEFGGSILSMSKYFRIRKLTF